MRFLKHILCRWPLLRRSWGRGGGGNFKDLWSKDFCTLLNVTCCGFFISWWIIKSSNINRLYTLKRLNQTDEEWMSAWYSGVQGGRHHLRLPPSTELGAGLRPQQLPDDQRDRLHLDPLPANLVCATASLSLSPSQDSTSSRPCTHDWISLDWSKYGL